MKKGPGGPLILKKPVAYETAWNWIPGCARETDEAFVATEARAPEDDNGLGARELAPPCIPMAFYGLLPLALA